MSGVLGFKRLISHIEEYHFIYRRITGHGTYRRRVDRIQNRCNEAEIDRNQRSRACEDRLSLNETYSFAE